MEYEGVQKAWADCLNYSADVAYGEKKEPVRLLLAV